MPNFLLAGIGTCYVYFSQEKPNALIEKIFPFKIPETAPTPCRIPLAFLDGWSSKNCLYQSLVFMLGCQWLSLRILQ